MMRVTKLAQLIALSAVAWTGVTAQDAVISIDHVTYEYTPTALWAGHYHTVSIRFDFSGAPDPGFWYGSAGFEIYSPDGADWGFLQGSAGPLIETAASRGTLTVFEKHYYSSDRTIAGNWVVTGNNGLDPAPGSTGPNSGAAFYVAIFSLFGDAGLIGGIDSDIGMTLEFVTNYEAGSPPRMCIDTVTVGVTYWEWAAPGDVDYPVWDNGLGSTGPRCWELQHIDCCHGRVGNANGIGGDEPTISDVSVMIDAKFISGDCWYQIPCLREADLNRSGGWEPTCEDITISDISILIDYLFITGPELGLPDCWL
ncbi:hypothetical protein KAT92_05480 [Candidatus Babeliales bacterium]|nr:hypothetical protein [Candidatus Babeliales bacterium]